MNEVYEALRNGKNWDNTLFILTFDEHGGCYDHVPPPAAVSPDDTIIPASAGPYGSGFVFNRMGVRVPTVDQILAGTAPANSRPIQVVRTPNTRWQYSGGGFVVLDKLIEPFRKTDQDEMLAALNSQGGLDQCSLCFYQRDDLGDDGVWDNWRLEGPSFVWYFRGSPHVHVWVNVASDPSVATNKC